MKKIVAIEELAQFIVCAFAYFQFPAIVNNYWLLPLFFFPDLFAIGFLINKQMGAIMYNCSHHKAVAVVLFVAGYCTHQNLLLQVGIIMYAHSSFDRIIGYGLKYLDNPNKTHLGFIGKEKHKNTLIEF